MKIHVVVVVMLVFASIFIVVPLEKQSVSAIDLTGWQYYKKITIDHTKVYADLVDFPILFDNTSVSYAHAQADGDDFVFMANGNITQYNHEIEYFSANRLIAWVNVTSLSDSVDTVVWLYYGNTVCSSQQNVIGTWNSNYVMVQHMNGSSWSTIDDSTSNNNDVTGVSGVPLYQKAGVVGYCVNFTQTQYLSFANSVYEVQPVTVEVWHNPTKFNTGNYFIDNGASVAQGGFAIDLDTTSGSYFFVTRNDVANKGRYLIPAIHPRKYAWNYAVLTWDGGVATKGNYQLNYTQALLTWANTSNAAGQALIIGASKGGVFGYSGFIDEVRISKVVRNTSWLNTTYNSIYSPSSFLSVGAEINNPSYVPASIIPSAPIYFEARTQNSSWIQLNWTHGATGVDKTVIRANIDSYPTLSVGSTIYNGTLHGYNHTGLTNNTHWFYRCYAWNSTRAGCYNSTYLRSHDTTMGIPLVNVSMSLLNCTGSYTSEVGNKFVYQEDADDVNDVFGFCTLMVDGNWSTYEEVDGNTRRLILNYTVPSMCWNVTWMVKDYDFSASSVVYHNFSLNHSIVSQGYVKFKVDASWGDTNEVTYYVYYAEDYVMVYWDDDTTRFYEEAVTWYSYGYLVNFTSESQLNIQETLVNCTAINVSHWVSPFWDIWFNATGTGNGTGNASGSVIVNVNGRSFTWFFTVGLFGGVSFGMVLWRRKRRKEG